MEADRELYVDVRLVFDPCPHSYGKAHHGRQSDSTRLPNIFHYHPDNHVHFSTHKVVCKHFDKAI